MKKIISLILTLALLMGCATVLASCGKRTDDGAQISVYLGDDVTDFDPTDYYVNSNAEQLMSLLYEPLFTVNSKGKLTYAAAQKYSIDEQSREITITLRESYWSDGIRVRASDYIYAWRDRILTPDRANPAAALFYDVEGALAVKNGVVGKYGDDEHPLGLEASSTYELTITYREGADPNRLLRNLASVAAAPAREDVVAAADGYWSKRANTIVCNGPFHLSVLDTEDGAFTLKRNEGYHQAPTVDDPTGIVTPDKLVSFLAPSGESLSLTYADIESKTVFYASEAPLATLLADGNRAQRTDALSVYSYVFNTDIPLFAIPEVRRALSLAIDRNAIAAAVAVGKPATGFVSESVKDSSGKKLFHTSTLIASEAKLSEARALLQTVDLSGLSLSFTLSVADDEAELAAAELVKAAWQQLGFTVTVKAVGNVTNTIKDFTSDEKMTIVDSGIQTIVKDAARGIRTDANGNPTFEVVAIDWQMYSTDAFVGLATYAKSFCGCGATFSGGMTQLTSFGGWYDFNYDHLIQQAYTAANATDRDAALHAAEEYLAEQCPVIPVLSNENIAFCSSDISGVSTDDFGHFVLTEMKQKNYQQYLPKEKSAS